MMKVPSQLNPGGVFCVGKSLSMPTEKGLEGFIRLHDLASSNEKSKVAE